MGVPHDHLRRSLPQQLCYGAQIHPGHNKSTGKGMAVAMPAISIDLRLFERCRKPAPRALQGLASADREKTGAVPGFLDSPRNCPGASCATQFKGILRGSPFLVLGR
jgi:hypothetical protein